MESFSRNNKTSKCIEEEKCLESLQLILDGEASKQQEDIFMKHVEDCIPCFNHYQIDKAVKELIQTKVQKKDVPDKLIALIRDKILEFNETAL